MRGRGPAGASWDTQKPLRRIRGPGDGRRPQAGGGRVPLGAGGGPCRLVAALGDGQQQLRGAPSGASSGSYGVRGPLGSGGSLHLRGAPATGGSDPRGRAAAAAGSAGSRGRTTALGGGRRPRGVSSRCFGCRGPPGGGNRLCGGRGPPGAGRVCYGLLRVARTVCNGQWCFMESKGVTMPAVAAACGRANVEAVSRAASREALFKSHVMGGATSVLDGVQSMFTQTVCLILVELCLLLHDKY